MRTASRAGTSRTWSPTAPASAEEAHRAVSRVVVVEAQALNGEDATKLATELADRFMRRLVDAFTRSDGRQPAG